MKISRQNFQPEPVKLSSLAPLDLFEYEDDEHMFVSSVIREGRINIFRIINLRTGIEQELPADGEYLVNVLEQSNRLILKYKMD